ncbi:hook-length control protein FliK [Paracoccus pantotrophus]|nr:hook-length control protein FliK [Paracoccus pantotrophus]
MEVEFTCRQTGTASIDGRNSSVTCPGDCRSGAFSMFFDDQPQVDTSACQADSIHHPVTFENQDADADDVEEADNPASVLLIDRGLAADYKPLDGSEHAASADKGQATIMPLIEEVERAISEPPDGADRRSSRTEIRLQYLPDQDRADHAGSSNKAHTHGDASRECHPPYNFTRRSFGDGFLYLAKAYDSKIDIALPNTEMPSRPPPFFAEDVSGSRSDAGYLDINFQDDSISLKDYNIRAPSAAEISSTERIGKAPGIDPRQVMRQISGEAASAHAGRIEIVLDPAELGKVRMVISPGENPAVIVLAERQETFDFLKRNMDLLAKELRDAGLAGADISFSDGKDGWSSQNNFPTRKSDFLRQGDIRLQPEPITPQENTATSPNSGIDIRI